MDTCAMTTIQSNTENFVTILAINDNYNDTELKCQSSTNQWKKDSSMGMQPTHLSTKCLDNNYKTTCRTRIATCHAMNIEQPTTTKKSRSCDVELSSFNIPEATALPSSMNNLEISYYETTSTMVTKKKTEQPSNANITPTSAMKSNNTSTKKRNRVVIAPETSSGQIQKSNSEDDLLTTMNDSSTSILKRTAARKSRLTDSFLDAKERLEQTVQSNLVETKQTIAPHESTTLGQTLVILSEESINRNLGIEIVPIYDPQNTTRLRAIEIRQIESGGRIAADGRIKVGDLITEINLRPVYQMSISRARAYLYEIQSLPNPSLTIDRPITSFKKNTVEIPHRSQNPALGICSKPTLSALQQANTSAIGDTSFVSIVKKSDGFGFTVTSRETSKGERLFYIGNVKPCGAAFGYLKAGDRLLEVNDESVSELTQNGMVDRLKKLKVGETVRILVSRLNQADDCDNAVTTACEKSPSIRKPSKSVSVKRRNDDAECSGITEHDDGEIVTLDIALNDTGSAGLGLSLKARTVMKPDGSRNDCGIFIKKVLHGGAAYKDGRLKFNDRLIGIENINLRSFERNAEASEALTKCLKEIGPSATTVNLTILRSSQPSDVVIIDDVSERYGSLRIEEINNSTKLNVMNSNKTGDYVISIKPTRNGVEVYGDDRSMNVNDEKESVLEDRQRCASDDEISRTNFDIFSRENPTRRSVSEKRHLGKENDVSHTAVYQKIKSFRQASAHSLRDSGDLKGKSVDLTENDLRRCSSTQIRLSSALSAVRRESRIAYDELTTLSRFNSSMDSAKHCTSTSADAIRSGKSQHVRKTVPSALKKMHRIKPPNNPIETESTSKEHTRSDGELAMNSDIAAQADASSWDEQKIKRQRRKSSGGIFGRISQKFSGKSPDRLKEAKSNLKKDNERQKQIEDEKMRIREKYDYFKQKQNLQQQARLRVSQFDPCQVAASCSEYIRDDLNQVNGVDYCLNADKRERAPLDDLPVDDFVRVANSKFYDSIILRDRNMKSNMVRAGMDCNDIIPLCHALTRQTLNQCNVCPSTSIAMGALQVSTQGIKDRDQGDTMYHVTSKWKVQNINTWSHNRSTMQPAVRTTMMHSIHGSPIVPLDLLDPNRMKHCTLESSRRVNSQNFPINWYITNDFVHVHHESLRTFEERVSPEDTSSITNTCKHPIAFPISRNSSLPVHSHFSSHCDGSVHLAESKMLMFNTISSSPMRSCPRYHNGFYSANVSCHKSRPRLDALCFYPFVTQQEECVSDHMKTRKNIHLSQATFVSGANKHSSIVPQEWIVEVPYSNQNNSRCVQKFDTSGARHQRMYSEETEVDGISSNPNIDYLKLLRPLRVNRSEDARYSYPVHWY